jgi:hypothetical protein
MSKRFVGMFFIVSFFFLPSFSNGRTNKLTLDFSINYDSISFRHSPYNNQTMKKIRRVLKKEIKCVFVNVIVRNGKEERFNKIFLLNDTTPHVMEVSSGKCVIGCVAGTSKLTKEGRDTISDAVLLSAPIIFSIDKDASTSVTLDKSFVSCVSIHSILTRGNEFIDCQAVTMGSDDRLLKREVLKSDFGMIKFRLSKDTFQFLLNNVKRSDTLSKSHIPPGMYMIIFDISQVMDTVNNEIYFPANLIKTPNFLRLRN